MGFTRFLKDNAPFLATGTILLFCSSFGQTFFISIFAGHIRADYGLSHGAWGGTYTVATMASAAVMVWAGTLTDRFRVRALGAAVLSLLALACLMMAISPVLITLGLSVFLLRLMGQGMSAHLGIVAMARWFVGARGRAMAIAALGFSIGEAILPVSFVALMSWIDWRWLWVLAAVIPLALIPVVVRFLKLERTPQSLAAEAPVTGMRGRHWTRGQALRHPMFWAIFPTLFGISALGTAFLFHQVHLVELKGWAHVQLVALFPIYTATSVVTLFAVGAAMDRIGALRLLPFYQLPMVAMFLLIPVASTPLMMVLPLMMLGLTQGSGNTLLTGASAEIYGTVHLGSIKAALAAVGVLGSAAGPGITGLLIDRGMSLVDQMPWFAAYHVLASGLLWLGVMRARREMTAGPAAATVPLA